MSRHLLQTADFRSCGNWQFVLVGVVPNPPRRRKLHVVRNRLCSRFLTHSAVPPSSTRLTARLRDFCEIADLGSLPLLHFFFCGLRLCGFFSENLVTIRFDRDKRSVPCLRAAPSGAWPPFVALLSGQGDKRLP